MKIGVIRTITGHAGKASHGVQTIATAETNPKAAVEKRLTEKSLKLPTPHI